MQKKKQLEDVSFWLRIQIFIGLWTTVFVGCISYSTANVCMATKESMWGKKGFVPSYIVTHSPHRSVH